MKTIGGFNKKSVSISIFHFLISAFLFLGLCNSAFASYPAWGTAQTATHSPYTLTFKVPTSIVDLGKVRTSLNLTTSDINATFWQVVFRVYEYGLFSNTLIYTTTYQYPWFPLPTVIYDAIDFTTGTISATSSQKIFAEADIYDTPTHILYTLKTTSYNATVFSDDSYEPNNTFSAASNLGTGSISLSQLIQANNLDYYKFTASAGFLNYTITVNNFFNVAGNFDLYLYNSAQSLINQSTSTTDQEVISMLLPATGTYYIKVISADGGRGFYDLTVGAGASPVTPVADFSGTPTTINVGQSVAFTDLSTNTPTSWSWTFGDGGTSTTKNPSHTYNTAGTYTVALTATNAAGSNTKTRTNYITVNVLAPVADFSGTPTTINVGQSVSFTDLSTNTPTSWSWTFGDGGTSTTKNPSHTYTTGGSYTVALTASNAGGGNTKTRTNYITVNVLAPVADFSGTPTTINVGQSVAFTDLSTNTPTSWSWNFGDGGTSTTKNPSHTYSTAGSYTVALTASNAGGGNTKTRTNYITVNVLAPVADFSGTPTTINVGQSVAFTDLSTNTPTSWSWNFGDGGTSTTKNPSHTYSTAGSYTVALTASNAGGSNTKTRTNYIIVNVIVLTPVADFSGTPTTINVGQSVAFTDLSTNTPTSWSWTFGDGGTSTIQNPSHIFSTAGAYTVTLTATNSAGSNTKTRTNYIIVNVIVLTPVADFSGTPTTINVGQSVAFTDLSTNTPTSWSWTFGDGGTSTIQNPSHIFSTAGAYTVTLTATNSAGSNTKTRTNYITVNVIVLTPVADFSGTPTTINVGQSVAFTDLSTNTPTSWSWTFGDGGTSTIQNPSHTYSSAGSYTVTLTAANSAGSNTKTRTNYITVNVIVLTPVADFSGTPTTINIGQSVAFTDLSTNTPTTWIWNFGDGGASTLQNPSHTYSSAGSYTVTLTAANSAGSNTKTRTNYITVTIGVLPPIADFSGTPTTINVGQSVAFTDLSTNTPTSWSWTFGDGGTSNIKNPSHTYSTAGAYTVTLTATNSAGSNTKTRTNYINVTIGVLPPVADFSGTPTTINVGQSVAFTDLSTNTPTSWSWNFGDGGTSTIQNPGHTYAAAGYYTVILTVSNSAGSNIKTRTNYITVLNSYSNLLYLKGGDPANWTVTGIPGNQHEEIAQWTSNGYNVETMNLTTTTINAALLNNYQVLRLNGEGGPRNLTDAEGSAIYSWVISGGKLLADIGWTKHIPAVTLFGIQTIEGQNGGASGLSWYFHGAPIYDGPITGPEGGVNSFASSCMDHPVLAANNNLIVDYYKSGYPMVVHNQFGYGKIVVVFANAWSHDLDWSTNAYRATIFQADNLLFLQKCILYFQISSGQEDISPFEKNEPQVYSFPNPFTNIIKLQVHLQKPAVVTILISDMSGKIINQVVANQQYSAGLNEIEYSGGLLPDGIYCFEFIIGKAKLVKKIIKRSN